MLNFKYFFGIMHYKSQHMGLEQKFFGLTTGEKRLVWQPISTHTATLPFKHVFFYLLFIYL